MWQLLTFLLMTATVVLGVMEYRVQKRQQQCEEELQERGRQLERLRDHIEKTIWFEYNYVDVVLLGPRNSGKTSVAELWTSPWTQITALAPTATWRTYEASIHESDQYSRRDESLRVERKCVPTLRLRVHDYPGEDYYRVEALKKIRALGTKVVLIFNLRTGYFADDIEYARENAAYFSKIFIEEIDEHIRHLSGTIAKVCVVFGKSDLLPRDWSEDEAIEQLKSANELATTHIEALFSGKAEYHLISALTNQGLFRLLGSIGKVAVESEKERVRFDERIQRLEREFQAREV